MKFGNRSMENTQLKITFEKSSTDGKPQKFLSVEDFPLSSIDSFMTTRC